VHAWDFSLLIPCECECEHWAAQLCHSPSLSMPGASSARMLSDEELLGASWRAVYGTYLGFCGAKTISAFRA